jgi:tRNA pseudouridine38-40 synthase
VFEKALHKLTDEDIKVTGSGRTDAGVHASGQVISFQSEGSLPVPAFKNGLNSALPDDIQVLHAEEVHDTFNARRDAILRTYQYTISKRHRVIGRQYSWYPRMRLDVSDMQKAADHLLGEHDFSSFCKADPENENCISQVYSAQWTDTQEMMLFNITALRFFRHMIRIIIGTLIKVGNGTMHPDAFKDILASRDRQFAGETVPPHGLCLMRVEYPVTEPLN